MFFSISRRAPAVEHSSVAKQKVQGELGKTTDISTYAPGWRPCRGKCTYLLSLLLFLLDWLNLSSIFRFCQHCATKNEGYGLTLVDLMLLLKFSESFWWYFKVIWRMAALKVWWIIIQNSKLSVRWATANIFT